MRTIFTLRALLVWLMRFGITDFMNWKYIEIRAWLLCCWSVGLKSQAWYWHRLNPWCSTVFFPQHQLSMQTLIQCPDSPSVQFHASVSMLTLEMCVCLFVCVCVCMCVCVCWFLLDMMRKMLNEVLSCVYVINRVHCALGCLYIFCWPYPFL